MYDICYAFDDNYFDIAYVSIKSLIKNNATSEFCFHLLIFELKQEKIEIIRKYIEASQNSVLFYNIKDKVDFVRKNFNSEWANKISYVAFARLYILDVVPKYIEKILYLDCDTYVNGDITQLFLIEIDKKYCIATLDVLPSFLKSFIGLSKEHRYFNSGVILLNLKYMRLSDFNNKISKIWLRKERIIYPDQDILNILFEDNVLIVEPKYCVFYPEYSFNSDIIKKFIIESSNYEYTNAQLKSAKENPIIVHLVDSIFKRPWQLKSKHPFVDKWYVLKEEKEKRENNHFALNLSYILFLILPKYIFAKYYYQRRNRFLRKKYESEK